MKRGLFSGQDFEEEFRPLIPNYYPKKYREYTKQEINFLKINLKGSNRVLEAGIGIGRIISEIAPLVKEFYGVDNSAKNFSNVKILKLDLENIDDKFPDLFFDYTLCLWNTLGNLDNDALILKKLSKVTLKSIIVTVHKKGKIEDRINYYNTVGINYSRYNEQETFYFSGGTTSKAYSVNDLRRLAKKSGLILKNFKTLAGVVILAELGVNHVK